ncbi:nitrilase-related carbon-nitrogen hydrolase [Aggregatilineales bacterium SYSU G02658]
MTAALSVRVAAAQFEIGTDVAQNLATCCRMIDEAARVAPALLVLPEFCNHLSWYRDRAHSYEVAVTLDGEFLQAIAAKARQHGFYVMINCTVRRAPDTVTGTNILFDPTGRPIAIADKQVLMGNENNFLSRATVCAPIVDLPFARVGMYSCMDGVICETPRSLAVRGAQVLLNSLNSFALDEGALHVPVRAAENKVFVVAANKVGWLVPRGLAPLIAERVNVAPEQLQGAGESQIVAPDGTVLAKAPHSGEAVIYADIAPAAADDKLRPDGTDIMASRRPRIYAPIARPETPTPAPAPAQCIAEAWQGTDKDTLIAHLARTEASLIVLPERWGIVLDAPLAEQAQIGAALLAELTDALKPATYLALSVVEAVGEAFAHTSLLLSKAGVLLKQRSLHPCARHAWATVLADEVQACDTALGRIALIGGGDTIYPEAFRLAALQGAHVVACPTHILEAWELQTGLLERAAENRLNVCIGSRHGAHGGAAVLAISEDFTLWTTWRVRPFDGNISHPIVHRAAPNASNVIAAIFPHAAVNRMVSQQTNLVANRPHALLAGVMGAG